MAAIPTNQCAGTKLNGGRCKWHVPQPQQYCGRHDPSPAAVAARAAASKKAGLQLGKARRRAKARRDPKRLPMRTSEDIMQALELASAILNNPGCSERNVTRANAIKSLCTAALEAQKQLSLEAQLAAALEKVRALTGEEAAS